MYADGIDKSSLKAIQRGDAVMGWNRAWDRRSHYKLFTVLFHGLWRCRCSSSNSKLHNIHSFSRNHILFWHGCHSRNLKNETVLQKILIPKKYEIESKAINEGGVKAIGSVDDAELYSPSWDYLIIVEK